MYKAKDLQIVRMTKSYKIIIHTVKMNLLGNDKNNPSRYKYNSISKYKTEKSSIPISVYLNVYDFVEKVNQLQKAY